MEGRFQQGKMFDKYWVKSKFITKPNQTQIKQEMDLIDKNRCLGISSITQVCVMRP